MNIFTPVREITGGVDVKRLELPSGHDHLVAKAELGHLIQSIETNGLIKDAFPPDVARFKSVVTAWSGVYLNQVDVVAAEIGVERVDFDIAHGL